MLPCPFFSFWKPILGISCLLPSAISDLLPLQKVWYGYIPDLFCQPFRNQNHSHFLALFIFCDTVLLFFMASFYENYLSVSKTKSTTKQWNVKPALWWRLHPFSAGSLPSSLLSLARLWQEKRDYVLLTSPFCLCSTCTALFITNN